MADLNANRKRRLLASLDRALAQLGVQPPRRAARPAAETSRRREQARQEAAGSRRSYTELSAAIRREGGIRPNRDYPLSEIPPELRPKGGKRGGRGLAPDEMAQVLSSRGFHYDGDVELFTDLSKRKEALQRGRELTSRTRSRTSGGQTVCGPVKRGPDGRFLPVS